PGSVRQCQHELGDRLDGLPEPCQPECGADQPAADPWIGHVRRRGPEAALGVRGPYQRALRVRRRLRDPVVSDRERPVRRRLARTRRPAHAQSGLPRAGLPRPVAHAVLGVDSTSHASGTHVHAVEDGTQWEEGLTGGPLYKNGLVHPGMLRTTARASTTIEPSMYPWWINASRRKTSPPGR